MEQTEIKKLKKGIYLFIEPEVITIETIENSWKRFFEMIKNEPQLAMVVDVRKVSRPGQEERDLLKGNMKKLHDTKNVTNIVIVSGKNTWMNMVARFVLNGIGVPVSKMCKDLDEALAFLEK